MAPSKKNYKEKIIRRKEEKIEEQELPRYRDRAKERREDQNPDYEPGSLGSFHSVAPPGAVDLRAADAHKISIENSKYLGGDVEHTHLVKGLDFALLQKVRSEIDKKPDAEDDADGKSRASKEDQPLSFRTATAKLVYQWIVKPHTVIKSNEMFLPGRMAFIFNMEGGFATDIPTTLHRSKDDCPVSEEMVSVSVDSSVLDRIAKIMSYLRLGSSGKVLKKKKKERDIKGKLPSVANEYEEEEKPLKGNGSGMLNNHYQREMFPTPPPPPRKNSFVNHREMPPPAVARSEEEDIFVGEGINYDIPVSEDMDESPNRHKDEDPYLSGPAFGPVPPSDQPPQDWQMTQGYDGLQSQAMNDGYPEWSEYQYAEQLAYSQQYVQNPYDVQSDASILQDPRLMSQEEKDRGLGSVFLRDDNRLQQLRENDSREKDPNFISESYSECYPGYQDYNREVVSDDDGDLSKMDMGGRAKGRLHRWDFESEEEWATYNEQKEAMPKAAFQFGVKMQDGRKTRKQNKDQKITNELHKINKILARKKGGEGDDGDGAEHYDEDLQPGKKIRI